MLSLDPRNSYEAGLQAGRAIVHVNRMGWDKRRSVAAAREWADHYVPNGRPGTSWRYGFTTALRSGGIDA